MRDARRPLAGAVTVDDTLTRRMERLPCNPSGIVDPNFSDLA